MRKNLLISFLCSFLIMFITVGCKGNKSEKEQENSIVETTTIIDDNELNSITESEIKIESDVESAVEKEVETEDIEREPEIESTVEVEKELDIESTVDEEESKTESEIEIDERVTTYDKNKVSYKPDACLDSENTRDFVYTLFDKDNYDKSDVAMSRYAILEELRNTELGSIKIKNIFENFGELKIIDFDTSFIQFYNTVFEKANLNIKVEDFNWYLFDNGDLTLLDAFCIDHHFYINGDGELKLTNSWVNGVTGISWVIVNSWLNGEIPLDKVCYNLTHTDVKNILKGKLSITDVQVTRNKEIPELMDVRVEYNIEQETEIYNALDYILVIGFRDKNSKEVKYYRDFECSELTNKRIVNDTKIFSNIDYFDMSNIETFGYIIQTTKNLGAISMFADNMQVIDENLYKVEENERGFFITNTSSTPIRFNIEVQYDKGVLSNDLFWYGRGRAIELGVNETVYLEKDTENMHKLLLGNWYYTEESMEWERLEVDGYRETVDYYGKEVPKIIN